MFATQYGFQFLKKIQKLSFWHVFRGWFLLCGIVVGRFEIVLGRCGSFRVLVTTRNSTATTEEWHININKEASNWGNFPSKFTTGSEDEQASLWPLTSCPQRAVQEKSGPYRSSGVFCTLWSVCFYRWPCRKRCAVRICLDLCAPVSNYWLSRISGQVAGGGGDYVSTLQYFKTDSKGERTIVGRTQFRMKWFKNEIK